MLVSGSLDPDRYAVLRMPFLAAVASSAKNSKKEALANRRA